MRPIVPLIGGETNCNGTTFSGKGQITIITVFLMMGSLDVDDQHILEHSNNEVPHYHLSHVTVQECDDCACPAPVYLR